MKLVILVLLFSFCIGSFGRHFDGGTIRWEPINPYSNAVSVKIKITQSYNWAFPTIKCKNDVPITTPGRSTENSNLTCTADCTSDGGYSSQPIDILTDCTSSSSSLGMMSSQRSKTISLAAGAHFYLANLGSAWIALNSPPQSNLQWSIVTFIDLRKRPDGFINTPPVAVVSSPQYAFVNQTIQITIPVSDENTDDDIRCRWSRFTSGYRRRREADELIELNSHLPKRTVEYDEYDGIDDVDEDGEQEGEENEEDNQSILSREKRSTFCTGGCWRKCLCTDPVCIGTTCNGTRCTRKKIGGCLPIVDPNDTTTTEVPGTIKSTSSFPKQQTIDECGDICHPDSLPPNTTLDGCTITFTATVAGAWYGVALQVEDFMNTTSNVPMSSVPVQFLIFVQPPPDCSIPPQIQNLTDCLEAQVGVQVSFTIYAKNLCDPNETRLSDILMSTSLAGINSSDLVEVTRAGLLAYVSFTWKPTAAQIGYQQMCFVAYTDEQVQSTPYCITFTVKNTSDICVTTTTTLTTTTMETSSSTTETTTTTTSTSLATSTTTASTETTSSSSESTTSTTSTTTSTTTTSDTTSTTSETTTTTSTSTSTSTVTTDTSTTSTSTSSSSTTSTTSTTTATTTTSTSRSTSATSTSTTTTVTTTTTTSATTSTVTTKVSSTTKKPNTSPNWLLILGLSLLGLLLACCCLCCWLYWFFWRGIGKRRRRRRQEEKRNDRGKVDFDSEIFRYEDPFKNHQEASRLSKQTTDFESTIDRSLSSKLLLPEKKVGNNVRLEHSNNISNQSRLSEPPTRLSTNNDEQITRQSKIQVKHVRRIEIDKHNSKAGSDSIIGRHASPSTLSQSAIFVNHRPNPEVTQENESLVNSTSKTSTKRRISVSKVPHNELPRTKRLSRSHSRSRKSINQIEPIDALNASHKKNEKASHSVRVTKLPRQSTIHV